MNAKALYTVAKLIQKDSTVVVVAVHPCSEYFCLNTGCVVNNAFWNLIMITGLQWIQIIPDVEKMLQPY